MPEPKALSVNIDSFNNDYKEQLRDSLRASIARTMPAEMLDAMVKQAIEEFYTDKVIEVPSSYGQSAKRTQPSHLKQIVWDLLKEDVKKILIEYFEQPEWRVSMKGEAGVVIGDKLKDLVLSLGPQLMMSMFGYAIQQHTADMMNKLRTAGLNIW